MTRLTSDVEALTEMFASGLVSLLGDLVRLGVHPRRDLRHRLAARAVLDGHGAHPLRRRGVLPRLGARRLPRDPRQAGPPQRLPPGAPVGHQGRAGLRARGPRRGRVRRHQRRLPPRELARDLRGRVALLDRRGRGLDRDRRPAVARRRPHRGRHAHLRRPRGVHRVPGQVLRAHPRPVDEVHGHAAGHGGGRARVLPARHAVPGRPADGGSLSLEDASEEPPSSSSTTSPSVTEKTAPSSRTSR